MDKNSKFDETISQIKQQITILLNDTSVPRNVKAALEEAKKALEGEGSYGVRASTATYKIDEISNDINLSPYARTVIWSILSMLESIKD